MAAHDNSSPPAAAVLAPGTLISGRYRIETVLGQGGMGIVYLAEHVHIRKHLALKVLLPALMNTPEMVARFEREAIAAGAVSHPNVASASDFGRLDDGSFFLVLEYLQGRTLRAELASGALPVARALAIARGVALGASAAHAKGIVHRDLKPENVMLVTRDDERDFVKVLDFGLARLEEGGAETPLTCAGTVVGTPHYIAPEQVLGVGVDARADLYALGVMLVEMLTGARPFEGGGVTVLRQHLLSSAPPVSPEVLERVPVGVRPLVVRLLERDPAARYANALELVAALDASMAALAAPSIPIIRPTAPARTASRLAAAALLVRRAMVALIRDERVARGVAWVREHPKTLLAVAGAAVAAMAVVATAPTRAAGAVPAVAPATVDPAVPAPPSAPQEIELDDSTPAPGGAVLSCLEGKFADHVARGEPEGDARGIAAGRTAIYWVDIANRGRPTHVTLVWTIDGREVQRQKLEVGRSTHWRTWGAHKVDGAREIEVQLLDASGRSLKADSVTLAG
jgi:hypothetical protein